MSSVPANHIAFGLAARVARPLHCYDRCDTPCCRGIVILLLGLFCLSVPRLLQAADPPEAKQPAPRPNIVFVLTDDQAPWAVGAAGHPHARTPHMDRLFAQGATLANAFTTTPVCSPSRAGLMTSRLGSELGITEWINPRVEPQLGLDPQTVTWPEVLQAAGYHTALIGKWHLGVPPRFHPTRTGFDEFMGFLSGGTKVKNPLLEKDGQDQQFEGVTTDILTDHAIEFLRRQESEPFALCLHFRAPHAPWLPVADEDWAPFQDLDPEIPNPDYPKLNVKDLKRRTREYLASVAGVDRNLGRLLNTLDELKLTENTVVIYTSDHGYNMGHNGIWHKGNGHWILTEPPAATKNVPKGQRPNLYDNSIRVPTAIRWPGTISAGRTIPQTVSNLDWYPTLLAIAGAKRPEGVLLRGRDFTPLLKGQPIADWDDDFYAEYSTRHQSHTHMRMYRAPRWKLVRDFLNPERDELYDLQRDPAETNNLIDSDSPEIQAVIDRLHQRILAKMREVKDPVLSLVPPPA
jgi:uncharacterized sulfatase